MIYLRFYKIEGVLVELMNAEGNSLLRLKRDHLLTATKSPANQCQ
jgi:hypothetical protein